MSHSTRFKKIQKFSPDYSTNVITQYESIRTGMRVVVVDQEGPKVDGYFALATEIHDDSGAPHTLEHLCFMGSKNYQYKGVLDKLATRAYSNTNAWTATDHTAYTLNTAGWEGFAQILPVYLEHVIVPTLTDSGCYTEVHHVDGNGNDAGVVYSEMQGVQNNQDELMDLKSKRLLYPEGVGFRYETGGMMENLRVLTADRIRAFHREMYQPKNLCVIIIGAVDHANLLDILDGFETMILEDIPKPDAPFKRPWVDSAQAPPLVRTVIETVQFPEEDESSGEIAISMFGPSYADSLLCAFPNAPAQLLLMYTSAAAMNVLLTYLAGSSASVLENTLVEREQVTSGVNPSWDYRPSILLQFFLSSVATENLEQVETRFFKLLEETAAKPIDLEYIRDCVKRERRQIKYQAESSGRFFADPIITDFLFGNRDGSTLKGDLENLKDYDTLETWTDDEWRHWLKVWMLETPHVTVLGKPSAKLSDKLKSEEKARVAARREALKGAGLKELEDKLAAAKLENDREIPRGVLERFQVPGTESIHFINSTTARSGAARQLGKLENPIQNIIDQDTDLPLFIHFEHIRSNFAHLNLILSTEAVPIHLRPLLAVYMDIFFKTPMLRDGQLVEFEQVIMELERDTVGYNIDRGRRIGNSEVLVVTLQVEVEKYQTAIRWLTDLMRSSVFDLERIKATTATILSDIPDEKRSGNDMMAAAELMVGTAPSSISRACSTLVKAVYLKRVKRILTVEPDQVIEQLKEINAAILQPSNFRVLVIANVEKLQHPVSSWGTLTKGLDISKPLNQLETRLSRLSEQGKNLGNTAYIISLPTIDSSFATVVSRGPSSYDDPSIPALMVAVSYLNAVEGPLWTAVRGTGLAYGTSLYRHTDSGQISLDIYRSPDAFKAFNASKEIVQGFVSGKSEFETLALEGAISAIVLSMANAEATMASAAQSSFVRQVIRGLPKDWNNVILEKVRKVGVEEIKKVMRDFVQPLFEGKTANLFATCAPIMVDDLIKGYENHGFKPELKPLTYFQDDYGLKGDDDAAEDEEEDTEEEADGEDGDEEVTS